MEEGCGGIGDDPVSGGCDFDAFAVGVREIEQEGARMARIATGGDTAVNGKAGSAGQGVGFESADGLAERVIGGRFAVLAIEGVDEPVAEAGREDGANLMAERAEGEADEGLAVGGGEGGGGGGVVEEEFDLGMHWLSP